MGVWADLSEIENSPKCYTVDLVSAAEEQAIQGAYEREFGDTDADAGTSSR